MNISCSGNNLGTRGEVERKLFRLLPISLSEAGVVFLEAAVLWSKILLQAETGPKAGAWAGHCSRRPRVRCQEHNF